MTQKEEKYKQGKEMLTRVKRIQSRFNNKLEERFRGCSIASVPQRKRNFGSRAERERERERQRDSGPYSYGGLVCFN
jgi:hypothetical protein